MGSIRRNVAIIVSLAAWALLPRPVMATPPAYTVGGMERRSSTHPGVTFIIPPSEVKKWQQELLKDPSWWGRPSPDEVLGNLNKRFTEMADTFSAQRSRLPSCLSEAIDAFLAALKARNRDLHYIWFAEFGWATVIFQEGHAITDAPDTVRVYNAFLQRRECGINVIASLTADILFHELIHATRDNYPKCFKRLPFEQEEMSTEDASVRIFGGSNVCQVYRFDKGYPEYLATYENLCKCITGCPLQ